MLSFLQNLLMAAGAATAVVAVVILWGGMFLAVGGDLAWVTKHFIQSHKDTKLFHQIEEFRRDFP